MRRGGLAVGLLLCLAAAGACRARDHAAGGAAGDDAGASAGGGREPAEIRFDARGKLLFIYADLAGRFQTASAIGEVPEGSRKVVRVLDPGVTRPTSPLYDRVHVADLTRPGEKGEFVAVLVERSEFELRALAALPPGQGSRVALPEVSPPSASSPSRPSPQPPQPSHGEVILYGTSWCGACRLVRDYLREHHVTFSERDIERDPAVARELAVKAAAAGISADRIPIIDVRGRLVVGFDAARLATLLGEET